MTAHVFVVSSLTFDLHLKHLFVGTGSKDHQVDFNSNTISVLHASSEKMLASMLADAARLRAGDAVYFYVQQDSHSEGRFYGIFECVDDGAFLDVKDKTQYLRNELEKNLNIRALIKPREVFAEGISEWELLDDISSLTKPYQLIWSLIYRKLKGNRGNTMITLYEEKQIETKLRQKNSQSIKFPSQSFFTFNTLEGKIELGKGKFNYQGSSTKINLMPRLKYKYEKGEAFEAHLQAVIVDSILKGSNKSLDDSIFENHILEWLGNEVSCGVGMQRIDILTQTRFTDKTIISPIELKAVPFQLKNLKQVQRYIDWLRLYYVPTMPGVIRPILITKDLESSEELSESVFYEKVNEFNHINSDCAPLVWVTFKFKGSNLSFSAKSY